jgi:large subunit ribosomal protein L24
MKIHIGDSVVVTTGKDKGKTGTVLRVMAKDQRVVVSGINMRTRHIKKTFQEAGRIVKFEASIHASNVAILDPKTKKASRVGYKIDEKGKKTRISKASGQAVVKVTPKKEKKVKTEKADKKSDDAESPATDASAKQPFWKRMSFGGGASAEGGEASEGRTNEGGSSQNIPMRKGSRGS